MSPVRAVRLDERPVGVPQSSTWRVEDVDLPEMAERTFLVQVELISLDPAMRGWLDDRPSYLPPVGVGDVMRANAVGVIVESRHPRFPVGTRVQGLFGVQTHVVSDGRGVTMVDETLGTPAMYLGVLGNTGLTAYFGLFDHGRPRAGDTVVVSAAAGAVGSIVGQLGHIAGCHTVGLAGGPEKCEILTRDLGYDHAIDYRTADLRTAFANACPRGIDVYFDNVGGPILNAALANLAHGGRVVICGAISQYNATEPPSGPSNYWRLLMSRGSMTGFLVFDHAADYPIARQRLAAWVAAGRISAPDTIVTGRIDDFHDVFLRLFSGDNIGKLILDISAGN